MSWFEWNFLECANRVSACIDTVDALKKTIKWYGNKNEIKVSELCLCAHSKSLYENIPV